MPKSRLSEAIGVQRVKVGNKDKSEAWLVKGTSCKYVLIGVFIIVGCFVAAIVATQISFVTEKHALVQEEKAHAAVEVELEKRFLEVGSLLENELRRRLKRTKISEAVHAAVQGSLDSVTFPEKTVYSGDEQFVQLVTAVKAVGGKVSSIMATYADNMLEEATRSEKLLERIAKHLGGQQTDLLLEDTASGAKAKKKKLTKKEMEVEKERLKKAKELKIKKSGDLRERAKKAKERVAKSAPSSGSRDSSGSDEKLDRRERIREELKKGKGRIAMRKEKDVAAATHVKASMEKKGGMIPAKIQKGEPEKPGAASNEDFIQGRSLHTLLIRFFMRLNHIDSVVFPEDVKTKITDIKDQHTRTVATIEAESSTKREKSQKLREHWDKTIEDLQDVLDSEGVVGVRSARLNHASWMVDELLKELQNVIDVQELKEPLFQLEEQFKSGTDADAITVMKELQKMAHKGDLPYEWVFGGSTGLSSSGRKGEDATKRGAHPNPWHNGLEKDKDKDKEDNDDYYDYDDQEELNQHQGLLGAPQYAWWEDYPREVDSPGWQPPHDIADFLSQEFDRTQQHLEHMRRAKRNRVRQHSRSDRDHDRDHEDPVDEEELEARAKLREETGGRRKRPERPQRRRWGDFGAGEAEGGSRRKRVAERERRRPRHRDDEADAMERHRAHPDDEMETTD